MQVEIIISLYIFDTALPKVFWYGRTKEPRRDEREKKPLQIQTFGVTTLIERVR